MRQHGDVQDKKKTVGIARKERDSANDKIATATQEVNQEKTTSCASQDRDSSECISLVLLL